MRLKYCLLLLLLIINGVLLGSILGMPWLPASFDDAREPQRLAAQVRREAMTLLPPMEDTARTASEPATSASDAMASDAVSAPSANKGCLEIGGFSRAQWQAASASLEALRVRLPPEQWHPIERRDSDRLWVRMRPFTERQAAQDAVTKLRAQGISDVSIVSDTEAGRHTVSLGVFRDPARAERLRIELQAKQVETEVVPDPRAPQRTWLQVQGIDAEIEAALTSVATRYSLTPPTPCRQAS